MVKFSLTYSNLGVGLPVRLSPLKLARRMAADTELRLNDGAKR